MSRYHTQKAKINQLTATAQHMDPFTVETNTIACHAVTLVCKQELVCVVCVRWSELWRSAPCQRSFTRVCSDGPLWADECVFGTSNATFSSLICCISIHMLFLHKPYVQSTRCIKLTQRCQIYLLRHTATTVFAFLFPFPEINKCRLLSQVVPRPKISCKSPPQDAVLCGQAEISGKSYEKKTKQKETNSAG